MMEKVNTIKFNAKNCDVYDGNTFNNVGKESKKLKDYIFRLHIRQLHIRLLFLTHDDLITCFMSAKNFIK